MSEITAYGREVDRPACAKCGGTGYVYLWSMERARGHTWFCDRCKLSWLASDALAAREVAVLITEPAVAVPPRVGVAVGEASVTDTRRAAVLDRQP
jgi:hypothetical protein